MRVRSLVLIVVLAAGSSALAAPPKGAAHQAPQPLQRSKPVVLASADEVRAPATDPAQQASTSPKRRIARVTTCRCGDPQPGDVTDENPDQ